LRKAAQLNGSIALLKVIFVCLGKQFPGIRTSCHGNYSAVRSRATAPSKGSGPGSAILAARFELFTARTRVDEIVFCAQRGKIYAVFAAFSVLTH
jgi:hypothetical protein